MTIDPNLVYDSFTFYPDRYDNPIWTIEGSLSGDLLAGLIVGLDLMLNDMFENYRGNLENSIVKVMRMKRSITIDFSDAEDMGDTLENFYKRMARIEDIIKPDAYVDDPVLNMFWWWIKDIMNHKIYKLYVFKTPEFIQGFITICSAFKVDYHNYVLGGPFKYNNYEEAPTYYDIDPVPQT